MWFLDDPQKAIELYATSTNYLVCDIETSNIDKGDACNEDNRIILGHFANSYTGVRGSFLGEASFGLLSEKMHAADFIVTHGGKFELKWFKRMGIEIDRILTYDTLLGEYVLAGNRKFSLDLNSTSKRYGGAGKGSVVSRLIANGVCPSIIPNVLLQEYCKRDVLETERVFLQQRKVLRDNGLLPVFYLRNITTPVLAEIELNGIHLDKEICNDVHRQANYRHHEIMLELDTITGGINMASSQQVAKFLYQDMHFAELKDRNGKPIRGKPSKAFPEGNPRTDEETILRLKASTKEQKRFLELKLEESKLRKKITGYTERFVKACEESNGILHGKFNQTVARNHRLSSSEPNLQNIDRTLKKCITARVPEWSIVSGDEKTLEMRAAIELAQDKQGLIDIGNKHDFHSFTEQSIFGGKGGKRTEAKPYTFRPLFGGNSGTRKEKAYYDAFRTRYEGVVRTQESWSKRVVSDKRLTLATGLILYWPDTVYETSGWVRNTTQIYNYPISNVSFEIVSLSLVLLYHKMKQLNLKSFLVNTVHDSWQTESPPKEVSTVRNLMETIGSKSVLQKFKEIFKYNWTTPLEVEVEAARCWK